jgi:aldehyde:ferredoxin oxidoreductase
MIGNGTQFTGDKLGSKRIPTVKGQCMAGYDPRGLKGTGTTYATSTMGADHTCGNALPSPANPDYNPGASTGQAPVSKFLQHYFAAIDSLGLCLFAALPILDIPDLKQFVVDAAAAAMGESVDDQFVETLGESVIQVERKFNLDAGFTNKDDRLPEFFSQEPIAPHNVVWDISDEEIDTFWNF